MPRSDRSEIGLETGMFSVHQMHPELALRLGLSVALRGMARNGMSLQSWIDGFGTALVVVSADVEYRRPLTFFTAPTVRAEAHVDLREDGNLVIFHMRHYVDDDEAIRMRLATRPVKVSGGPALDAVPAAVDDRVRALFEPDEIVPRREAPTRYLKANIQRMLEGAEQVGGGVRPLQIARADCELADQWLFSRLPSLVASAREQLSFDGVPDLAKCLSKPISKFEAEYFRPMYFGDRGQIEATLYKRGEQTFVVHRVRGEPAANGSGAEGTLCALAVEMF
jgi:acyl-CoA thioesterase FadM